MKIIELNNITSTNEYCKNLNCDAIVFAKRQTQGKGTKGRSFSSCEGGIYVSVLKHYNNFPSSQAFRIMINSCVAVCKTLEHFGIKPIIRWANDVLVGGKKICGTLIENTFSGNYITRSIVGMGINVNNALPAEIDGIATSISKELKRELDLQTVKSVLLEKLNKDYTIYDYKSYIDWFGTDITLIMQNGKIKATASDVDEGGNLICEIDGQIKKISAAEVSLRIYD